MTGKGPRKAVEGGHAPARLLQAREFHESARSLVTLAQSKSYNPAVTLMVTAVRAAPRSKRRSACSRSWTTSRRGPKAMLEAEEASGRAAASREGRRGMMPCEA